MPLVTFKSRENIKNISISWALESSWLSQYVYTKLEYDLFFPYGDMFS